MSSVNDTLAKYTQCPINEPTLLAVMHEVITTRVSVNATGNKPHYDSLNTKARDFGYQSTITSIDGLLKKIRLYVQLCNM